MTHSKPKPPDPNDQRLRPLSLATQAVCLAMVREPLIAVETEKKRLRRALFEIARADVGHLASVGYGVVFSASAASSFVLGYLVQQPWLSVIVSAAIGGLFATWLSRGITWVAFDLYAAPIWRMLDRDRDELAQRLEDGENWSVVFHAACRDTVRGPSIARCFFFGAWTAIRRIFKAPKFD